MNDCNLSMQNRILIAFFRRSCGPRPQFVRQFGFELNRDICDRMVQSQAPGVQKHALQSGPRQLPVEFEIAVFVITSNRMTGV